MPSLSTLLQLLVFGLSNGAVLALNAIGITVVYGTVRTLNMAHGDVFALTSIIVTTVVTSLGVQQGWPPAILAGALLLTLGVAMLFGAGVNVAIERLAFKPFRSRSRLAPLIATLGISFILFQVAIFWRFALPTWIRGVHHGEGAPTDQVPLEGIPNLLSNVDLVKAVGLPIDVTFRFNNLLVLLIAVGCALGVTVFLNRTASGRAIRACSQNPVLAQICGVNPDSAIRRAFVFGGMLAGAAAFVFALYYGRSFGSHGAESGLLAFTAAILGGIGNPMGALLSGLMLGVFAAFSDYFLAAQWTPVLLQLLLVSLLILRPTGLIRQEGIEDLTPNATRDSVLNTLGQNLRQNSRLIWTLAAVALILPLALGAYTQVLLTGIGVFVLLALGLNLQLGIAGILDLGYAVSYGIGSYAAALATTWGIGAGGAPQQPPDFIAVLILAALTAGLFGGLKGLLALRIRSDHLAVATVSLALLARQFISNTNGILGGIQGIAALPPPHIFAFPIARPIAQYYLVCALIVGVAVLSQRLIHSRIGRAWLASSEDETAAASCGIDVSRYKALALTISCAIAGVAGALHASIFAYTAPQTMDFRISAMILAMVILGGAGNVSGSIIGAVTIVGYSQLLIPRLTDLLAQLHVNFISLGQTSDLREMSYFNFGLALYLTVLFRARRNSQME